MSLKNLLVIVFIVTFSLFQNKAYGIAHKDRVAIVVSQDGKGNFKTIQEAINAAIPSASQHDRVIIFIKKGVYREKVFIEKDNIKLIGEDRDSTIITISLARDIWKCSNADDWGCATLNLKGNDITLQNLTITNTYGFDNTGEVTIPCPLDTVKKVKSVKKDGHQMALRSFTTTRLIAINCVFRAGGGDTVSPWNKEDGLFYFKDCVMEGGVDFYCPRGWAYAEGCTFICHSKTAAIWHDGSKYPSSRTVLKNCTFTGDPGYKLGRHHRDAQFYLLNCSFSETMANAPIYSSAPEGQPLQWGERIYYFNCHRTGGDFDWHKDNMNNVDPTKIGFEWTFEGKWKLR